MEDDEKKSESKLKRNRTAGAGKYTYKYVDIAQIHEYLAENNMRYYQYIDVIDGNDYIMTVRILDGEELPAVRGCRVVDSTLMGINNPAQQQGSALTYARRYSLLMAFGLATEDDDAQSLSKPKEEITTKEQALKYKLNFGKYSGKTIEEILKIDMQYANWLYNNDKTDETIKSCLDLLKIENKGVNQ